MSADRTPSRFDDLLARKAPLIELVAVLKGGTSAEVACEGINRCSEDVFAYPYGPPSKQPIRSIMIQVDPGVAAQLGLIVSRVLINPEVEEAGYMWECVGYGHLGDVIARFADDIDLSQPGAYDEAQPWQG